MLHVHGSCQVIYTKAGGGQQQDHTEVSSLEVLKVLLVLFPEEQCNMLRGNKLQSEEVAFTRAWKFLI